MTSIVNNKYFCFTQCFQGGLCHNNINISSVFVADDGTWKLGAMECVCKFNDATPSFLLEHKPLRLDKIIAPEERVNKIN